MDNKKKFPVTSDDARQLAATGGLIGIAFLAGMKTGADHPQWVNDIANSPIQTLWFAAKIAFAGAAFMVVTTPAPQVMEWGWHRAKQALRLGRN